MMSVILTNLVIALILGGDFFTGAVLAATLTKLVLRFTDVSTDVVAKNTFRAEVTSSFFYKCSTQLC
jgi:uncharacterized membrane protein YczE